MFDYIIVGAGPAGVSAAYQLQNKNVLVLDAGLDAIPGRQLPPKNIYDIRRDGDEIFSEVIGDSFEGLHNVFFEYMSPKLKSPLMRYVAELPAGEKKPESDDFDACISYAKGGLASAWGAGLLRFTANDLRGFPVSVAELAPFYDELTRHIGICGIEDDLTSHFGPVEDLQPPLPLSPVGQTFLKRYEKHRTKINRLSMTIGRTRPAILSRDHNGRQAYQFLAQDFFQPRIPAIYNPAFTLESLVKSRKVEYLSGKVVLSYQERDQGVRVHTRDVRSGITETFEARYLMLAAGAINTAKVVLAANSDYQIRLPILDNPVSFTPFIDPFRIGASPDLHAFAGGELVAIYEGELSDEPIQSSIYGLMGPLRADLAFQMPLSVRGNLIALKYLVPALTVLQTFYPDRPEEQNYLQLLESGTLRIRYTAKELGIIERHLCRTLRSMGYFSLPFLSQFHKPGSSIHYAGCLPMSERAEGPYHTDRNGQLFGTRRVFVADAATFPRLPSKNLSFTIMANAMRIASFVEKINRKTRPAPV